ncbi:MAG TPA: energy transducer TonB [Vicinamibacterales bacterium]|nr:energy transducer TonB [Vicinamibacterales bacterium]
MPRLFTIGSIVAHTVVVGGALAAQALAVGPLPTLQVPLTFEGAIPVRIADIPLPPPPRRVPASNVPQTSRNAAPVVAPSTIRAEPALEAVPDRSLEPGAVYSGIGSNGITDGGAIVERLPPPPPPAPQTPVPIGGRIAPPRQLVRVAPVYPALARASHVSGVVILETTIDARGNVADVRVLRSIPLLDQAAIDAVRQWSFTPTLLNGVAVPVVMTVTVNFTLAQP